MTIVFQPIREFLRNAGEYQNDDSKRTVNDEERFEPVWVPAADITENEAAFTLDIDLPGLTREDIKIAVENNVLTISGQRKEKTVGNEKMYFHNERVSGAFKRSFNLSKLIDSNAIEAVYENGVLSLRLPKAEEAKPREITVKIA